LSRAAVLVAGLAAPFALLAAPALACDAGDRSGAVKHRPRSERAPLIVGDSTMIIATPLLGRRGFVADARGCRQFSAGVSLLAARRRAGRLPRVVVLALGANGPIARGSVVRALRVLGRSRVLVLVTPRQSAGSVAAIRWAARRFPSRVMVVDWAGFSGGRRGWFAGDGLHVSHTGARAFANLVRRRVRPLVDPPLRLLRLPRRVAKAAEVCGRWVAVTRGAERIACTRARQLARTPRFRLVPGWRYYDVRGTGRRPWTGAWVRRDRRVVVGVAR
jgi:hypothetical protein